MPLGVSVALGMLFRSTPLITLLGFCGWALGIPAFVSGVVLLPVSGFCCSVLLPTALFAGEIWLPESVALLKLPLVVPAFVPVFVFELPVFVLVKTPLVPVLK